MSRVGSRIFANIVSGLSSCFQKNSIKEQTRPLKKNEVESMLDKIEERYGCEEEALRRSTLVVDRYISSKRLKKKYFAVQRDEILSDKLSPARFEWLKGLQGKKAQLRAANPFEWEMGRLPKGKQWKMGVDYADWKWGREFYDSDEPGYQKGMRSAFRLLRRTTNQKLNADLYIKLHDRAVDGVEKENFFGEDVPFLKGLGDGRVKYGILLKRVSLAARREWECHDLIWDFGRSDYLVRDACDASKAKYAGVHFRTAKNYAAIGPVVPSNLRNPEERRAYLRNRLEGILSEHYEKMDGATTEQEKLEVIAFTCRHLEVSHFFQDGNQRTVAFLVLNKFLIDEGLTPCMLPEPLDFDGYKSVEELVGEIYKGQYIFQSQVNWPVINQV